MFTNIDNEARVELFRTDVVERLQGAVKSLSTLADARKGDPVEFARLTDKAAGVQQVLTTYGEKITNVRNIEDVVTIIGFVNILDGATEAEISGLRLAHGYLCEYVR